MTNKLIVGFLIVLFSFSIPHAGVSSKAQARLQSHYVEGEILVKFREDLSPYVDREQLAQEILQAPGVRSEALSRSGERSLRLVHLDGSLTVQEALISAKRDRRVEFAEPNYLFRASEIVPNDPFFPQMWGLLNTTLEGPNVDIGAVRAWDITTGSEDVVVAVLDTGVDFSHPDLAPNAWRNPLEIAANGVDDDGNGYADDVNGWNFRSNNNSVFKDFEDDFHGTHVAGTIGAVGDNGIGIAGVAWHVKLMSLKFLGGEDGTGSSADAVKAIEYAIEQKQRGVNVRAINASWGGEGESKSLRLSVQKAGQEGILFVASAGNSELDMDTSPEYPSAWSSNLSSLISVAALHSAGSIDDYSNYGHATVSVGAPGSYIYSTLPGGAYDYLTGTSMAAPHVTGIVALLASHEATLTPAEIKQRIITTAEPTLTLAARSASAGRASAFNALTNTIPPPPKPGIARIHANKKVVTVDAIGLVKGSSVLVVEGVEITDAKYLYDDSFAVANGTFTRVSVKLGKPRLKRLFPLGHNVGVAIHNLATDEWSGQVGYER